MAKDSGQKFVGRNRPPPVQIEYDVENYGAKRSVQLPFVMGVMADLSGKPKEPLPPVKKRNFQLIDVDNFDDVMESISPRAVFKVPNRLSADDDALLSVELQFESMDDFLPDRIAQNLKSGDAHPLRELLDARRDLNALLHYIDGKDNAEALIEVLLDNAPLLKAIAELRKNRAEQTTSNAEES